MDLPCDKLASASCAPPCSLPLDPASVLALFHREARSGEFDTGRYRCPYFEWGAGPALVFVPGLCDDRLSFVMPVARLSDRFRCISYDLPAGHDGARLARYRHSDYVDDLLALVDHLKLGETFLFGSSFGSTVVLEALRRRPEQFPRAILQGGFARRPLAPAEVLLADFARYWPGNMGRLPLREAILGRSHAKPFEGRDPRRWGYFIERFNSPPMAAVARRALIVKDLDLRPVVGQVSQPVLMVCGEYDPVVGKSCEEELLRLLPHAVRAEIENCGHMPQFSHPEVLAELIERFLTLRNFLA